MPDATTLMTPKTRDLLQKPEQSASVVGFEEAVVDFFVDAADLRALGADATEHDARSCPQR